MDDTQVMQLASLSRKEKALREKRNALNDDARKVATSRNQLNDEVSVLIKGAKEQQEKRDNANNSVNEIKEIINNVNKEIQAINEKLPELEEQAKKSPRGRAPPIGALRRQIKHAEWKLQTTVMSIDKERALVDHIAELEEKYEKARKLHGAKIELKKAYSKIRRIESKQQRLYNQMRYAVKQSQEFHVLMTQSWKDVEGKKKEADKVHKEYLEVKTKADLVHKEIQETRDEIKKIRGTMYESRRKREVERQQFIKERLEQKAKVAYDKLKEGGKLTKGSVTVEHAVDSGKKVLYGIGLLGVGAETGAQGSHGQRSGDAFAHDVAECQDEAVIGESDEVVEVTADVVAGHVDTGQIEAGQRGWMGGDEVALDLSGQAELPGDAFGLDCVGVKAGIDDGSGRLGGDGLGK